MRHGRRSGLKKSRSDLGGGGRGLVPVWRFVSPRPGGTLENSPAIHRGLWREYETSPVWDERTRRSNSIFSFAPPAAGALAIFHPQPTVETVG